MDTAFSIGLRAIHSGFEKASRNAERVAHAFRPGSDQDGIEPLVELARNTREVHAGAAIIKVARELQHYTLDIVA